MHEHLQDSDLLSSHQWGFCSGQSIMLALAIVTHNWFYVLEEGKEVFAVFFDYKRYLTSTLYLPLTKKLKKLPFHSCIVETGYLTHHLQYVVVNGHSSDLLPVKAGVPQGSQLGPLLFHNLCIFNIDLHQHGIFQFMQTTFYSAIPSTLMQTTFTFSRALRVQCIGQMRSTIPYP